MEGVTVVLRACVLGGVPRDVLTHTTTTEGGFYEFTNLEPGDYTAEVLAPTAFIFSPMNVGDVSEDEDSDFDPETGVAPCVSLSSGEELLNVSAGLIQGLIPDIKANGSDEDIVILASDALEVTVALGSHAPASDVLGEFWIVAQSPSGRFSFVVTDEATGTGEWLPGLLPARVSNLNGFGVQTVLLLDHAGDLLPDGATTFNFAIDLLPNGALDDTIADAVTVTVVP
jgi:hypothetical protein